jgi:hypothetical protein
MLTKQAEFPQVVESDNTTATSPTRKIVATTTAGHLRYAESLVKTLTATLASPPPTSADDQEFWRKQMAGIAGELVAHAVAVEHDLTAGH